jgi:hypothetical protein
MGAEKTGMKKNFPDFEAALVRAGMELRRKKAADRRNEEWPVPKRKTANQHSRRSVF